MVPCEMLKQHCCLLDERAIRIDAPERSERRVKGGLGQRGAAGAGSPRVRPRG
jgi:hypothetical protein